MRGARGVTMTFGTDIGITPAYAGRTHHPGSNAGRMGDHPRVCGAHVAPFVGKISNPGSPPRMRGALTQLKKESR